MAKVSVIIPVYNVEQYLRQCLDSVVNQTLKDIEIICVNDGSTDKSLQILKAYAKIDIRIKVISKANSGYGHTMNVGLDNAIGEYIGIVESDDYVALDMYETLYKYAIKHNVDLIKADFYGFTVERGKPKLVYRDLSLGQNHYYHKVLDPSKNLELFRFIMNTWTGIYNKNFIDKYNIRHNETPGASYQDNGFFFQTFCRATKVFFLAKPFYMNRRDNPNSSVKNKSKVFCMKDEYDFIKDIINKDSDLKLKFLPIFYVKKFHNYMFTYNRIDEKYKRLFLDHFSTEFTKAKENGELDRHLFTKTEWNALSKILHDPEVYHRLDRIRNSRISKIITFLPCTCVKFIAIMLKGNKFTRPLYKFLRHTKHHGLATALRKTKYWFDMT